MALSSHHLLKHQLDQQQRRSRIHRHELGRHLTHTLAIVLVAYRGHRVLVELRADQRLDGLLVEIDEHWNMIMKDVSYKNNEFESEERYFDEIEVRGSNVRYVHLPDHLGPVRAVSELERKIERTMQMKQRRKMNRRRLPELAPVLHGIDRNNSASALDA